MTVITQQSIHENGFPHQHPLELVIQQFPESPLCLQNIKRSVRARKQTKNKGGEESNNYYRILHYRGHLNLLEHQ